MSKAKNNEPVKISVLGIEMIKKPTESYLLRVEELLRDHYEKAHTLNEDNLMTLMELKISTQILVTYLRDLCEQAHEAKVSHLYLAPQEIKMIASLSKSISAAATIQIGNTNLRDQ